MLYTFTAATLAAQRARDLERAANRDRLVRRARAAQRTRERAERPWRGPVKDAAS